MPARTSLDFIKFWLNTLPWLLCAHNVAARHPLRKVISKDQYLQSLASGPDRGQKGRIHYSTGLAV